MAKWWPFGRKDKEPGPAPAPRPEQTPAPAPRPEQAPAPAPAQEEKRSGLLGRLFGRGRKKEAPPEAPPTPTAPPTAPTPPPEEPPTEGAPPEEAPTPSAPPPPERTYPPFLHVDADGVWIISDTQWEGTMSGTLHGADVKTFIDAMEQEGGPDYETAIPLVADAYGIPGGLVDVGSSAVHSVRY